MTILMKPDRDINFYVHWCPTRHAPVAWGTRDDFLARDHPGSTAVRLDQADEDGSTAGPDELRADYDEETMIVRDLPQIDAFIQERFGDGVSVRCYVPRGNIQALCDALQHGTPYLDLLDTHVKSRQES